MVNTLREILHYCLEGGHPTRSSINIVEGAIVPWTMHTTPGGNPNPSKPSHSAARPTAVGLSQGVGRSHCPAVTVHLCILVPPELPLDSPPEHT